MLSLIIYMLIGAILFYIFVGSGKLEESLPEWYEEYESKYKDEPHGYFDREMFDRVVGATMVLWFVFMWPTALYMLISKLIKGKK